MNELMIALSEYRSILTPVAYGLLLLPTVIVLIKMVKEIN